MKKKILIPIILFIIAFITFIDSLSNVFQEKTYLDITEENKQIIYNAFNNYVENIDEVYRV